MVGNAERTMAKRTGFRLTAWLAATSLALAAACPARPSRAQDTGGPESDPPALVGRLSLLSGEVSSHGPGATAWTPAVLNFPFTSGDALWTQPGAQADVEVGSSVMVLAPQTELDLSTLDDRALVASEPQGALFLDLRHLGAEDTYTINTPRGLVQIATDGSYEIIAGDAQRPTRVVVVRGAAQLTSGNLALRVQAGQAAVARGGQTVEGGVEPVASYDRFLTTMLARDSAPITAPRQVLGMTGAENLGRYGTWQDNPDYGEVWVPRVSPQWAPYREGSWAYVEPWGWTWVDSDPWGFAPFHYGRWAQLDQRWCWVPGEPGATVYSEPVYAPALVDFVVAGAVAGVATGVLISALQSGRGDVGWVPLGPRERYRPPYGGSGRYLRRLNPGHGWRQPEWNGGHEHGFANRHGMTIVPVEAMAHSQPISHARRRNDIAAGRDARNTGFVQPLHGRLPIQPTRETRGVTPVVAQQQHLAGPPLHPRVPGPPIAAPVTRRDGVPPRRIPLRDAAAQPGRPMPMVPGPVIRRPASPGFASPSTPLMRPTRPVPPSPALPPRPFLAVRPPHAIGPEPARPRFVQPLAPRPPPMAMPRPFAPREPFPSRVAPPMMPRAVPSPRLAPPANKGLPPR